MIKILTTVLITADRVLDTEALVSKFGLSEGEIINITRIAVSSDGAGRLTIGFDKESDDPYVLKDLSGSNVNAMAIDISVTGQMFQFCTGNGQKVIDKISFSPSAGNWLVVFCYDKIKGNLDWVKESVENIPDIRSLDARDSRTAGQEFFQPGDFNKVGG